MAAIRKRGKSWRVQIRRRGHPPQFKAFDTRADAEAWARQIESEMDRSAFASRVEAEKTLIADLLDRYKREITPSKRSSRVVAVTSHRAPRIRHTQLQQPTPNLGLHTLPACHIDLKP